MLRVIKGDIKRSLARFQQTVNWYEGRLCSCVGENNGTPKSNHSCNLGFYYEQPEATVCIRTQISYKYRNTPQGRIYEGGATFTIPKFYNGIEQKAYSRISHGDIIVVSNKNKRDTDILLRGVRDSIYAFDVSEILSIYSNNTKYTQGVDFTTTEAATIAGKLTTINWVEGKGPATNEYYTAEFICKQQFKVWEDAGNDRGTETDNLPKKILTVMRRFVNPEPFDLEMIETKNDVWGNNED